MAKETKQQVIDRLMAEISKLKSYTVEKEEDLMRIKARISKVIGASYFERRTALGAVEQLIERNVALNNRLRMAEREIEMRKEQEKKLWKLAQGVIIEPNEAVTVSEYHPEEDSNKCDDPESAIREFFKKGFVPPYARD
jgi:hydroxylamine reductase (hybrid-cluster protein)